MENHLYIENVITGEKEYILSFGESITIGKGSVIRGTKFKISVSDKLEYPANLKEGPLSVSTNKQSNE